MASLYTLQGRNVRKTWVYIFFFLVLVIAVGWAISFALEDVSILYIAVALSIIMSFGSFWWSDKIVLASTKAREVNRRDNPELYRLLENLCITAGLPVPKLYVINSPQPNAFATGRNADNAVVAVTTGLLEKLDRAELEGVLAHELAHIGNRDILLQTVVVVLVGVIVIATDFFFRIAFWGGVGGRNRGGDGGDARLKLIMIVVALALAILAPLFAQMLKLAISRKREFLADATGALLTRYPEGLAKALEKIAADPHEMKTANDATAHLFIASPFRGKNSKRWLHRLFMTHPPVEDRVRALRDMHL